MNNTKRNRNEDATAVIALLATLKKTSDAASRFEEYKNDFESYKSALTHVLATAPEQDDNAAVTLGGVRYLLNTSGVESMLLRMDQLNSKYQKAAAAKDKLPNALAEYANIIWEVIEGGTNQPSIPVNQKTFSDCHVCAEDVQERTTSDYEYLLQLIQVISNRLSEFEGGKVGKVAFSAAKDAMTPDIMELRGAILKINQRIDMLESRIEELEELGERVPDFEEELHDINERINSLEKPPIHIPVGTCNQSKLMKLFGITAAPTEEPVQSQEGDIDCSDKHGASEMETIDIPEIIDTNDITYVDTGDIKVGRIGNNINNNINIEIGGDLIINGDEDVK